MRRPLGGVIEAVFEAPMDDPPQADEAVAAAPDMRARLASLNEKRSQPPGKPLCRGRGILAGPALAGLLGSKFKICLRLGRRLHKRRVKDTRT